MKRNYRYTVLGLLFLATTINYIDRQIIGLLKPTLEKEFQWTEQDYANIVFWFQMMYAVGYFLSGRFVDKVGAKIGLFCTGTVKTNDAGYADIDWVHFNKI